MLHQDKDKWHGWKPLLTSILVETNSPDSDNTIVVTTEQGAPIGAPVQACAVDHLRPQVKTHDRFPVSLKMSTEMRCWSSYSDQE